MIKRGCNLLQYDVVAPFEYQIIEETELIYCQSNWFTVSLGLFFLKAVSLVL
jgi:hypothetical protein